MQPTIGVNTRPVHAASGVRPVAWHRACRAGLLAYYLSGLIVFLGVLLGVELLDPMDEHRSPQKIQACNDVVLHGMSQWDGQH